jgi:hypothetical protein
MYSPSGSEAKIKAQNELKSASVMKKALAGGRLYIRLNRLGTRVLCAMLTFQGPVPNLYPQLFPC